MTICISVWTFDIRVKGDAIEQYEDGSTPYIATQSRSLQEKLQK